VSEDVEEPAEPDTSASGNNEADAHSAPGRDPFSQPYGPALEDLIKQVARTQRAIRDQIVRAAPGAAIVEQVRSSIEGQRKSLIEPAIKAAAAIREQLREALPDNWRDLNGDEFRGVLELCEEGKVTVVWAPRAEIVKELATAGSQPEREKVLVARREEILADVRIAIDAAARSAVSGHQEAKDQALEAVGAAEAGFDRAAQTLFASALGHILEGSLGFERPGKAFKEFKGRDLDEALMVELRLISLQLGTVNALTDTDESPEGFNRHGTQHGSPGYLTEPAMLGAALLVAGWIRELSWISENRPDLLK
jgi:hypothetical protein